MAKIKNISPLGEVIIPALNDLVVGAGAIVDVTLTLRLLVDVTIRLNIST